MAPCLVPPALLGAEFTKQSPLSEEALLCFVSPPPLLQLHAVPWAGQLSSASFLYVLYNKQETRESWTSPAPAPAGLGIFPRDQRLIDRLVSNSTVVICDAVSDL